MKRSTSEKKKSAKKRKTHSSCSGRLYTVSVALPGSIISNAQTAQLQTYLAGQVARALAIFNVDEVVVFDEQSDSTGCGHGKRHVDPNVFLGRILHYMETPQYLRKALFPMHSDFRHVGILNPLDCPHHMRQSEVSPYREGVVLETSASSGHSLVNCGLEQISTQHTLLTRYTQLRAEGPGAVYVVWRLCTKAVEVDKSLAAGVRVTVAMDNTSEARVKKIKGRVVTPSSPRTDAGLYWGYTVRMASSLGAVFTEAPYEGGYDLTIGTSERGDNIDELDSLPPFRHALVVLGGVRGLEYALQCDHTLQVEEVSLLFHHYLNVCPNQGSRTIRTEEALLVVLTSLRHFLVSANH